MIERDGYIPGVPCWADTAQPDPEAAAAFYGELFGWELEDVIPADAPGDAKYLVGRIRGGDVAAVGSQPEGGPPQALWNTYIWVESVDRVASAVLDAGGKVLTEPFDVMEAGRMAVLADREGAAFSVWEAKRHRGSRIVNEPGSVVFNVLNTRDPESAKAFYGAVFGWGTLELGGSGAMWTLPGYADHLETIDPGVRERAAEGGAPEGFADVVAALEPIPDDRAATPAHWSITFGVADADATAAKAEELGGAVLAPPFDAPWVRMTVLADPAGATFTASKFVPENRDLPVAADAASG